MSASPCCTDTALRETTERAKPAKLRREPVWNATRSKDGFEIRVELPGVRKDDLKLEVTGRELHLAADRTATPESATLVHGEPAPDGYRLKLRLAEQLDGPALQARLEHGVLNLAVPLVEAAQPRAIEVR